MQYILPSLKLRQAKSVFLSPASSSTWSNTITILNLNVYLKYDKNFALNGKIFVRKPE